MPSGEAIGARVRFVDVRMVAGLALLWILAVVLANPVGDFPMVDDWAYAYSVKALLAGEGLKFSDWGATNLISQIFWGAGFAALFGDSHTVLRLSTLVLGLLGAAALYRLFRLAQVSPAMSLLAVAASVFNPLYFLLAFTFMTDVPYAAWQFLAMWALAEGLLARRWPLQALGWAFGLAALLCRQVGLFIPVGLVGEAVLRRPWRFRRVLLALIPLAGFFAVQWGFQTWLKASGKAPIFYGRQINMMGDLLHRPDWALLQAVELAIFCFFYLGLFALPVTLACAPLWRSLLSERWRRWAWPTVGALALVAFGIAVARDWQFPMWRDTLNLWSGTGVEDFGTPLPGWARPVVTIVSSLGGVLLVAALVGSVAAWWRSPRDRFDIAVFALVVGLALLAPVTLIQLRFDRYLIPVLPCVLLALTPLLAHRERWGRTPLAVGFGAAAVMGLLSIGGTHDYMAAKRVQLQAYQDTLRLAPARFVDGGWVLNGEASYGKAGSLDGLTPWYERADYVIGAKPALPGYEVISTYPVRRWLPWNRDGAVITVRRRIAAP